MSLCLLTETYCQFCGFCYRTLDDLIAHIEYSHIPFITSLEMSKDDDPDSSAHGAPITPLSTVCRLFTTPYDPLPCKPTEPMRLTFNHYRRSRNEYRRTDNVRDVSPCPIEGCKMRLGSNDAWKTHLFMVHGISERIYSQDDIHEIPGPHTASANSSQRIQRCVHCRRYFKTTSRLVEHMEKCRKKQGPSKPNEVVVKIEIDEDVFQAVSPVMKEDHIDKITYERNKDDTKQIEEAQPPESAAKEELSSELMFTDIPTSGHLLRRRLMEHRRTLMEDEKNDVKNY
ncbi:hypothetical protein RB195_012105 [Necator americanus]|uniref:C2H2-type domain-containing protein n=1 Tax=Necator americanus TaxID=51031 RepID=A0ABR1D5K1_NECAM